MDLFLANELKRYENYLKNNSSNDVDIYKFKSNVLKKNIPNYIKTCKKTEKEFSFRDIDTNNQFINQLFDMFGITQVLEGFRINNATKRRLSRLRSRVLKIVSSNRAYFLTFTFNDDTLLNTSKDTRRQYVRRFMKKYYYDFVGNIDYGGLNEREHYHAIVSSSHIHCNLWEYGSLNYELIKNSDKSIKKLSKYISKLVNHAIKESTKNEYLIYPKKKL